MQAVEGLSLEAQQVAIQQYCTMHQYELIRIHKDVLSGAKDQRPGLQEALATARTPKAAAYVQSGCCSASVTLCALASDPRPPEEIVEELSGEYAGPGRVREATLAARRRRNEASRALRAVALALCALLHRLRELLDDLLRRIDHLGGFDPDLGAHYRGGEADEQLARSFAPAR